MKKLHNFLGNFTSIVLLLMILNVFIDVVLRYFFNTTFIGVQEIEWHLFSVVFLFGISYALNEESHVRVDFLYDNRSTKIKAYINIFGTLFFLIPFALFITYGSYHFVYDSFLYGEISEDPGGLAYRWLIKLMIPVAFVVLFISAIGYIQTNIKRVSQ